MKIINYETRLLVFLGVVVILGIGALLWYVGDFQSRLIQRMALENSKIYANVLTEFRTLYTSEVVDRIRAHPDISVTHDYANRANAIPLPATLSMKLGENIGKQLSGAETFLYSPYPFPWRVQSGGLNDEFRLKAWNFLSRNPTKNYYEFAQVNGRDVIRFAQADLMRESCIGCHNNHPQSPKTGWQVGDVRGVLEVIQPLDIINHEARVGLNRLYWLVVPVIVMALLGVWGLVAQQRRNRQQLQLKLEERTKQVKLSEAKLATSEKMAALGLVSVGIAHEVNQPLGTMKLTLESLKNSLSNTDADVGNKLNRVLRQVERIDHIIKQLNVASSNHHQQLSWLDVNYTIMQVVEWMSDQLRANTIEVEMELSADMPTILMDQLELERVLTNLLTNAIHAMETCKDQRGLKLASYYDNNYIFIRISDTGIGITEQNKPKIFDPFYTTKEVGKGMGMGLSLVQGIMKKYGGNIQLVNTDIGACFLLSLPIKQASEA